MGTRTVEQSMAAGETIDDIRDDLDYRENNPVTGDVNVTEYPKGEPLVGPAACVQERLIVMLEALGAIGRPSTNSEGVLYRKAIKGGQEALLLCRKLLPLETTDPSRIEQDAKRAEDLIEKARA